MQPMSSTSPAAANSTSSGLRIRDQLVAQKKDVGAPPLDVRVRLGHPCGDRRQVALGLGERYIATQAADHAEHMLPMRFYVRDAGRHEHGHCINSLAADAEIGRQHTDHCARRCPNLYRATDDRRVAAQLCLPKGVRQHDLVVRFRRQIVCAKKAPKAWAHSERVEEVARNAEAREALHHPH